MSVEHLKKNFRREETREACLNKSCDERRTLSRQIDKNHIFENPRNPNFFKNVRGVDLSNYRLKKNGKPRGKIRLNTGRGEKFGEMQEKQFQAILERAKKPESRIQYMLAEITSDGPEKIFQSSNPRRGFKPASTLKPVTIAGAGIDTDEEVKRAANAICVSDNGDWGYFRDKGRGHVEIGRYFKSQGKEYYWHKKKRGKETSPAHMVQFLSDAYNGELDAGREILQIMYGCQTKGTRGEKYISQDTSIAAKTGSHANRDKGINSNHEIMLFEKNGKKYALAVFLEMDFIRISQNQGESYKNYLRRERNYNYRLIYEQNETMAILAGGLYRNT